MHNKKFKLAALCIILLIGTVVALQNGKVWIMRFQYRDILEQKIITRTPQFIRNNTRLIIKPDKKMPNFYSYDEDQIIDAILVDIWNNPPESLKELTSIATSAGDFVQMARILIPNLYSDRNVLNAITTNVQKEMELIDSKYRKKEAV